MPEKTIEPFAAIRNAPSLSSGDEDPSFRSVQAFLQRFGYLRSNTFSESRLDDRAVSMVTVI